MDDTPNPIEPLHQILLPQPSDALLGYNKVELEIAGVLVPIQKSEVTLLIGIAVGTKIWSNEGAAVVFGRRFGFVLGVVMVAWCSL